MPLTRTMQEGSGLKLEPGTYPVICTDVKGDTLENPSFGDGAIIRFSLKVEDMLDENGEEVVLDPIANDKLTPKSKLTEWLKAFGVVAEVGETINIEEAIGKRALAVVGTKPGKDGTGEFATVDSIIPAQKGRPQGPVNPSDLEIGEFWALTRTEGFERSHVLQVCEEMFKGKEPKDLTGKEREALFAAL